MTSVPVQQIVSMVQQRRGSDYRWTGVVALSVMLLLGVVLVLADVPPAPLGANVPVAQFSAERALEHVKAIGSGPHPVGSARHLEVENYITATLRQIGLTPEVQKATARDRWIDMPMPLENITAELKGSTPGKSVLLVAHYDSVSAGPGASDDGAAVATLLETAKILKSQAPFKRDIVFLFTDGEELGLMGAQAFVDQNPLAKNVGLVLNFEARGTSGPVILFETSDQNAWLIDNVSKAASHPVANSLSYEIYKRLPNDTDLTVFKRAGYQGLNFAFIEGVMNYHRATDTLQNLNRGSLQHQGDYAVELARWFGNVDQIEPGRGNAIYFDILGKVLVHYSSRTGVLLLIAAALLLAWVFFRGFQQKKLGAGRLAASVGIVVVGVLVALAAAFAIQRITVALAARFHHVHASTLSYGGYYVAAAVAFGLAVASIAYVWAMRRLGPVNVAAAAMLLWFALAVWATGWLQGMSYVWIWPLLFSALAWGLVLETGRQERSKLLLAGAIPAILIIVPLAHKVFTAFGLGSGLIVSALLALVLSLCAVQVGPDSMPRPLFLPITLCAAGAALFASALLM
ncbi:MAG TPA: M20/M25/M40 family metallo-hydrolase [Candidatus Angelobacter sp.]|nr:M20/M25/M40 family metallo-hydrolase [Candidatus Angelobacter sp.]